MDALVEDPFPTGVEGVDSSLATTSVVGQPPIDSLPLAGAQAGLGWGWWYFSHEVFGRSDEGLFKISE